VVCAIDAPCKINLHLRVLDRRPDGFHDLESLFAALSFGDSLRVEILPRSAGPEPVALVVRGRPVDVPPERNLVSRAVEMFRRETGFDGGCVVTLVKRTPTGAGLGGGSSDAASTLLALDRLTGAALPAETLARMARDLGSDAPFFLAGGAAWVTGRGEIVTPVASPATAAAPGGLAVLLVKPPFGSDTAGAYRRLDEARRAGPARDRAPRDHFDPAVVLAQPPGTWPFHNDFLDILPEAGVYRALIGRLRKLGAGYAGLSGSGSCCFGVFDGPEEAGRAAAALAVDETYSRFERENAFFLARRAEPVIE